MKTLVILILLIPCVVMAETFTMPLSTVDTNPATAASILSRPEITEYAERVQRIGNVFIIEWNQYDTEAVSVEYKALKPLGIVPPKSFDIEDSDELTSETSNIRDNDMRVRNIIFDIDKGTLPKEEIATIIEEIIIGGMTDLGVLPQGLTLKLALDYDYELGKQFIVYMHENYKNGAYNITDDLIGYSRENNKTEDAILLIKYLLSLKSGAENKYGQEQIEKDYNEAIKMMQPPD